MRRLWIFIALLLILIAVAAVVFIGMIRRGFSAQDQPSAVEAFLAARMRRWAVPASMRSMKNPVTLTPRVLAEARAHFADHCATCHGNDGRGRTDIGQNLYPKAPDMTLPSTQSLSDGELFATIENGIRMTGMPAFGGGTAASRLASWKLVHFIRHLPHLTPDERLEMEKLNPKTPEEWEQMKAEEEFLRGAKP